MEYLGSIASELKALLDRKCDERERSNPRSDFSAEARVACAAIG